MLEYEIKATRIDAHGSIVRCKEAEIVLDTDLAGRADAFNPAKFGTVFNTVAPGTSLSGTLRRKESGK